MKSSKHLIKVGTLFAIIIACGIFIWQASAGVWKFDSTKSTVAKINTSQVGRWTGGLVGHWSFDGQNTNWTAQTTSDKSGNNNTGRMINMSTTTSPQPGKIGQALNFDGTDDYVDVPDADSLSFGDSVTDSPFSINAWVYMHDASSFRILTKGVIGNWEYIMLTDVADILQFVLFDSSGVVYIGRSYGTVLTSYENQWMHIVGTYDGLGVSTGIKIYLNGSQVDDTNVNLSSYTAMHNGTANVTIGKYTTTYANGLIDEVRIYSRALSAGEIQEQYLAGAGAGAHINP